MYMFKEMVLWVVFASAAYMACITTYEMYQVKRTQAVLEGKCIARYIAVGIERRDIVADKGTCHVIRTTK